MAETGQELKLQQRQQWESKVATGVGPDVPFQKQRAEAKARVVVVKELTPQQRQQREPKKAMTRTRQNLALPQQATKVKARDVIAKALKPQQRQQRKPKKATM